jgi:hypothetical protein
MRCSEYRSQFQMHWNSTLQQRGHMTCNDAAVSAVQVQHDAVQQCAGAPVRCQLTFTFGPVSDELR